MKNIFGTELIACRKSNSQDQRGSWDARGMCSDRGKMDPGVHQICFSVRGDTENFSEATYQSDWSRDRKDKHHCMCLGAYSLYKQRQKIGEIPETDNELKCHAIPETALSQKYLKNWAKWNGYEGEYKLHENYTHALQKLCNQCTEQANTESEASGLRRLCDRMMTFGSV